MVEAIDILIKNRDVSVSQRFISMSPMEVEKFLPIICEAAIDSVSSDFSDFKVYNMWNVAKGISAKLTPRSIIQNSNWILRFSRSLIKMKFSDGVLRDLGMGRTDIIAMNLLGIIPLLEILQNSKDSLVKETVIDIAVDYLELCRESDTALSMVSHRIASLVQNYPKYASSRIEVFCNIMLSHSNSSMLVIPCIECLAVHNMDPVLNRIEAIVESIESSHVNLYVLCNLIELIIKKCPQQCSILVGVLNKAISTKYVESIALDCLSLLLKLNPSIKPSMSAVKETIMSRPSLLIGSSTGAAGSKFLTLYSFGHYEDSKRSLNILLEQLCHAPHNLAPVILDAVYNIASNVKNRKDLLEPVVDVVQHFALRTKSSINLCAAIVGLNEGKEVNPSEHFGSNVTLPASDMSDELSQDSASYSHCPPEGTMNATKGTKGSVDMEGVELYVSSLSYEMREYFNSIIGKIPIPNKFDATMIEKRCLTLSFECSTGCDDCEPKDFFVETEEINDWLKIGICAAALGSAVFVNEVSAGLNAIIETFQFYNDNFEECFETFIYHPFLTSDESDALISKLKHSGIFDNMYYNPRVGGWQCWYCFNRDKVPHPMEYSTGSLKSHSQRQLRQQKLNSLRFQSPMTKLGSGLFRSWKPIYCIYENRTFSIRSADERSIVKYSLFIDDIERIENLKFEDCGENAAFRLHCTFKVFTLNCQNVHMKSLWIRVLSGLDVI